MDSGMSDEGYNSSPIKATKKSFPKSRPTDDERVAERIISRNQKDFKAKYFIEKVLINSANGVIYQGNSSTFNSTLIQICLRLSKVRWV